MNKKYFILVFIVSSFLAGCNAYTPKEVLNANGPGSVGGVSVSYEFVKAQVFQPYCISCHSSAGGNPNGVNLETYSNTIQNLAAIENQAITKGTMPPSHALPTSTQDILSQWIAAGAPE